MPFKFFRIIAAVFLLGVGAGKICFAQPEPAGLKATLETLAAWPDRTTAGEGNRAAAAYIQSRFEALDLETGRHRFATAVRVYGRSQLFLPNQSRAHELHPLVSNAVSPGTIGPNGLSGPLVYVGAGELSAFNGRTMAGAVVLMELDSGRNWLRAAEFGARALIYIDRGVTPKAFFKEKFELTPIRLPRFWMPVETARKLFGAFETASDGLVAEQVRLTSDVQWQEVITENVYAMIEGRDAQLHEELLVVEAFYDTGALVPGMAPGADEASSIAGLLELARLFKHSPPKRSVLLVATGGHGQRLAGMREMIWSLTERSRELRKLEKRLKKQAKASRQIIAALTTAGAPKGSAGAPTIDAGSPAVAALQERIKSEVDRLSRRLMRLRMEQRSQEHQVQIQLLAQRRLLLRRLGWREDYRELTPAQQTIVERLLPLTLADEQAVLAAAKKQLKLLKSARRFRSVVRSKELQAVISLHLSSHGDGLGAFNRGGMYPLKPTINRVNAYTRIDAVLREAGRAMERRPALAGLFKDTLRPSRKHSWQSFLPDLPPLGGEVTSLGGLLGITLATTHDRRAFWGTPYDTTARLDWNYLRRQLTVVAGLVRHVADAGQITNGIAPRFGFAKVIGRANFLRHGELFADQPAPHSTILAYQELGLYHCMVDPMGYFLLKGVADSKHVLHKVIIEGYRFDAATGEVKWAIDKKQTGKAAYRLKMRRRTMETDLVMFACRQTTLFNLLEPRTFRYMTKMQLIDGRREAPPLRYWYSRIDTRKSIIASTYLEPETRLKMTLSDTVLRKKLILLNSDETTPQGTGYHVQQYPVLQHTQYRVARDMWALLAPRIANLEECGIFNERIRDLQQRGLTALNTAKQALQAKYYDRYAEASARAWALASRVYDDVEKTQKDVLFGVLFYIALFVPFAFCAERLLFSYRSIYKRIGAFCGILGILIAVIYKVHPAFKLAYSPMVVILAFFIMGLSFIVTLIIFFRFEDEMTLLQSRARQMQAGELSRWKAFAAAFMLGISNLRRRRLRTALTCMTLIILTFTIMSFTSVKTMRQHTRLLYEPTAPYQGFLLKNVNWRSLPPEAMGILTNAFAQRGQVAPRVWLEDDDRTRSLTVPVNRHSRSFNARGVVGLSPREINVTGLDRILVGGRWLRAGENDVILIPERMARQLKIDPHHPAGARVSVWGLTFRVVGVFAGSKLQHHVDLDGEPLTPVIFPRELSSALTEVEVEAMESGDDVRAFQSRYEHIPGDLTVIVPYRTLLAAGGRLKDIAVRPAAGTDILKTARDLVDRFGLTLFSGETGGTYLYHAGDTMSYSGVPNIVIPLMISVFIVLNTMIGSVYERKREIAVYTSVGLAPSHVAFLFIAEALAFAVLSVVLGYLVAQTSASLFSKTALWAGITVNYSSLAGVAAMFLVILVVLVSVIYPAKVAAQIAIPDIHRSWKLPPARGNRLHLTLPFLMKHHEHRSIGGYLLDYFQSHQDVSHGVFSADDLQFEFVCPTPPSDPNTAVAEDDCQPQACAFDACLQVVGRVWLAPFDFGIMQTVKLAFCPSDGEDGFLEINIDLQREAGEAHMWHRINKIFLHNIRRRLLMWRSLEDDDKKYYAQLLQSTVDAA